VVGDWCSVFGMLHSVSSISWTCLEVVKQGWHFDIMTAIYQKLYGMSAGVVLPPKFLVVYI
jgi:hypothetical protein